MIDNQRNPLKRDVENKAGELYEELSEQELQEVSGGTILLTLSPSVTCTQHDSCSSICMSA